MPFTTLLDQSDNLEISRLMGRVVGGILILLVLLLIARKFGKRRK